MVDWDVTVGNLTLTQVFDVQYDNGQKKTLGKANVVCANNNTNRSVSSGDRVTITRNGSIDFKGYVTGKPTKAGASKTEIEINCVEQRAELKYQQVNRVFYQEDSGDIIRSVINEKLVPYSLSSDEYGNWISQGDDISNWSSDVPKFSLGEISTLNLENAGGDFLFIGWPSGSNSSPYNVKYENLPNDTIPGDGQLDTFFTRFAMNNNGDIFTVEIDLRDDFGNNYIWTVDIPESGFETYELKAETAVTDSILGDSGDELSTDGTLEYRIHIDGSLPDSRAMALDFASTIPYSTTTRDTDIDPGGVQSTGNVITRRIERSAFSMLKELSTEDNFISYVDNNDTLYYEPPGQNNASSIDFNSTNVVEATFNRDYQEITNRVTVQGNGDIRVTVEDTSSVSFYGISGREEPIVDKEIQTENEARRRANGFLRENAWNDEAFEFVIADDAYQTVTLGDNIVVNWPPEDISGTYTITNVETDKDGLITVNLTQSGML